MNPARLEVLLGSLRELEAGPPETPGDSVEGGFVCRLEADESRVALRARLDEDTVGGIVVAPGQRPVAARFSGDKADDSPEELRERRGIRYCNAEIREFD